ncbi:MAG: AcvB/VirJ family lysyl-phosphatidylglycerol hydrolase [Ferruginibacter sp.]
MKWSGDKICLLLLFTLVMIRHSFAQGSTGTDQVPVNIIPAASDTSKPLIFYITGDGGWNKFSKNFSQALAGKGYPVISLNANEYFWKKKTAVQTALDITRLIRIYQRTWSRKKIMLVGYSFGADVMPFVFSLLPDDLSAQVVNINLISPATHTDFEIHIAVMFGAGFSGGESVVSAINKITTKPLTLVFGKGENEFPLNQLKIKNYVSITLDGGHHYDGDEANLCNTILKYIPKN